MDKIFLVEKACPLCSSDVYGNDNLKYYCKRCNLLFERKDLRILKQEFIGSKVSRKFHSFNCPSIRNLREENKVFFSAAEEAMKNGFKPCGLCMKKIKKKKQSKRENKEKKKEKKI
ncbi:MAG: Ada metal-binding domain-containing protein [Candidatus Woesearchaeota archaeon]